MVTRRWDSTVAGSESPFYEESARLPWENGRSVCSPNWIEPPFPITPVSSIITLMELELRWNRAWGRASLAQGESFHIIQSAYGEPHRTYHNLLHLRECFEALDSVLEPSAVAPAVELALWYHDLVYNPRAQDNEGDSAARASQALRRVGASSDLIGEVCELILATRHHSLVNPSENALLVVDVDLAILGALPERFDEYDLAIRKEYSWVDSRAFCHRRSGLLEAFLARPQIYFCPALKNRLEAQARANLQRSLRRLRAGLVSEGLG